MSAKLKYKFVSTLAPLFLIGSSSFLAGKEDNHNILVRTDSTRDFGASEKIP